MENKKLEILADPTPLGLLGFGMSTILLSINNTGYYPLASIIIFLGVFYGGFSQIIAGLLSYKRGDTFSFTVFCSYGFLWLTLVCIMVIPSFHNVKNSSPHFMGIFMLMWFTLTLFLFIGSFKHCVFERYLFFTVVILFLLLSLSDLLDSKLLLHIAGFEGIICGISAFYLAIAKILNNEFNKKIIPV